MFLIGKRGIVSVVMDSAFRNAGSMHSFGGSSFSGQCSMLWMLCLTLKCL